MDTHEYLTFRLGAEHYGIDILDVQEIRSHETPTRIANAQPQLLGVINLRGTIVPITDLRLQLGMGPVVIGAASVVIFARWRDGLVGLLVDAVSDVVAIPTEALCDAPALQMADGTPAIVRHVVSLEGRTVLLTDVAALMRLAPSHPSKYLRAAA